MNQVVGDQDFQFQFGQEIDHVLRATVERLVTLLTTEATYFRHRDARNPHAFEGFLDVIQLERFDDGLDLLHEFAGN